MSREEIHGQLSVLATVGALIAGFSVATSLAVEHDEVMAYVQWEATMFLGYNSQYCSVYIPNQFKCTRRISLWMYQRHAPRQPQRSRVCC